MLNMYPGNKAKPVSEGNPSEQGVLILVAQRDFSQYVHSYSYCALQTYSYHINFMFCRIKTTNVIKLYWDFVP